MFVPVLHELTEKSLGSCRRLVGGQLWLLHPEPSNGINAASYTFDIDL